MAGFDAQDYWQERGLNYTGSDSDAETDMLARIVGVVTTIGDWICEVGSGNGRVYMELKKKNLLPQRIFWMYDFVESLRNECKRRTGKLPMKWDGKTIPSEAKAFELVISSSVLLHVPPEDIQRVVAEHVRICRRYLFIATYTGPGEGLARHCFRHKYEQLFLEQNLQIIEELNTGKEHQSRTAWLLEKTK